MTSQNNSLTSQRGSALLVTMLLVSVLLATALILLQRIVPYAKSVRSIHDASQAYYVARGQVDMARLEFIYDWPPPTAFLPSPFLFGLLSQTYNTSLTTLSSSGKRINIYDTSVNTANDALFFYQNADGTFTPNLRLPFRQLNETTNKVIISANEQTPLQIKLFPTDLATKQFGTSKKNLAFHTLSSRNAGGLRFDLRGVDMSGNDFLLRFNPSSPLPGALTIITLKIQYLPDATAPMQTFTIDYPITTFTANTPTNLLDLSITGNIQFITSNDSVFTLSGATLSEFLRKSGAAISPPAGVLSTSVNCTNASICSLTLFLKNTTESIDFQLISNKKVPDLNAVVIGDGLSGNGLYYQRIIDLIPTPQDI